MDYADELKAAEVQKFSRQLAEKGLLIEQWNLDDLGADSPGGGMSGSRRRCTGFSRSC